MSNWFDKRLLSPPGLHAPDLLDQVLGDGHAHQVGVVVGGEGEEVMLRPTMQARMLHKIHPTSVFENSIWGGFYVNYNSVTMDNVFQSAESNESSCVCAASTSKRN